MAPNKFILYITGGTGFVGTALTKAWLARGERHGVVIQSRQAKRLAGVNPFGSRVRYVETYSELESVPDAVVNLAGAPIADERWTAGRRKELESSRVALTEALVAAMKVNPPEVFVSASAIGFYSLGEQPLNEESPVGDGYASSLCQRWEQAANEARFTRTVIARLGVVLGRGGVLKKVLPMYRLAAGGPIGNGRQWFSWVHIDDAVAYLLWLVDFPSCYGCYNIVAPEAVRQREFAAVLGQVVHRPAFLPTPAWVLRLVFGQMAEELLIQGQRVTSVKAECEGFSFRYPTLQPALEQVLSSS